MSSSTLTKRIFSILLNSAPDPIMNGSELVQLADDFLVFRTVQSNTDELSLQNDLDALAQWASDNDLLFSSRKSAHLRFSRKRDVTKSVQYCLARESIPTEPHVKYLGLFFDRKLSWKYHHENLTSRMYKRIRYQNTLF